MRSLSWHNRFHTELALTQISMRGYSVPFHGASVHFLFVVKQAVSCASNRNGGVQAQRFSCSQNQLTFQLQFVILKQRERTCYRKHQSLEDSGMEHHTSKSKCTLNENTQQGVSDKTY